MKIKNASRWAPRGGRPWLVAAAALVLASGARILLHPLVGPYLPGTAFCIAAALVEYYYGLAPALTVMLLGLGIADYLFVPPYAQIDVFNRADLTLLISYPIVTALVITLIERLRRHQFRAELIAAVAQSRYEMLLRADNERAIARRAVDETHRLLHHLPQHHDAIILIQALDRRAANEAGASARGVAFNACAPGRRFETVHPDDIRRLQATLTPGTQRVRIATTDGGYRHVDSICESFTTHAGDFLVLRVED